MKTISAKYDFLCVALLGFVFFVPFLGGVHLFDWDEINFAECAREMLVTGDYLRVYIDYKPFWEKPPLFIWLQVLSIKIFGVNEYAARFPNAVCGIVTLLTIFSIGKELYNRRFGWIWVGAYLGSILPHLYFHSGIIDPWFNWFIFVSLYFFIHFKWTVDHPASSEQSEYPSTVLITLAGIFIGLAILTKGPVAILIVGLCFGVYWMLERFRWYVPFGYFLLYGVVALMTTLLWFGLEILQNGTWFVEEFIIYQYRLFSTPDAGHKGFLGYHFVVLFLGCFPASIFALKGFRQKNIEQGNSRQKDFRRWMLILFWVVVILFSIVQSKIVHYSSLCYYPITFLAALVIHDFLQKKANISQWIQYTLITIGGLYALLLIALPFVGQNIDLLKPLFKRDPFALGNLEASIQWSGVEAVAGLFLLTAIIASIYFYKKGKTLKGIIAVFLGTSIFVNLTLVLIINKIEGYSQNAVIEFYKSKINEDCYVFPDYRSYAHLFYTHKKPMTNENAYQRDWLCKGDIDKDVYFVSKIHRVDRIQQCTNVEELYRKNGFVFWVRKKEAD